MRAFSTSRWQLAPGLLILLLGACLAACSDSGARASAPAFPNPLKVLVSNDDGVGAPGIDALVQALRTDSSLQVSVYAPSMNRSGSGGSFTRTGLVAQPAATISGYPSVEVSGFPADAVLFALLQDLPAKPDLIVTGINEGQNIAELTTLSGTVGAALAGVQLGVPAIATSLEIGHDDLFPEAAAYVLELVEAVRQQGNVFAGVALNVNYPGRKRSDLAGVRVVPLGRLSRVSGYTSTGTSGDMRTFDAVVTATDGANDPPNDAKLFEEGYVTLTPLRIDLGAPDQFEPFRFLER